MKRARGFTLIELAIVLVIITILIGGLAVPLSAQIEARRIAETRKILEEARDAVFGYAMTHPASSGNGALYLPCPDTDNPPDGKENRDAADQCVGRHGWFPWADLGTAAQDAWGNRLRYAVLLKHDDPAIGFTNPNKGFNKDEPKIDDFDHPLQIYATHTQAKLIADNVVFVLISHGPNGRGAWSINDTMLAAPSGLDEQENTPISQSRYTYVSRPFTRAEHTNDENEFDDLLIWVSHDQLIGRVCPTGCVLPIPP